MKILVINGSPKGENSNTMVVTRAFLEGAGWSDAEIINVTEAKVKDCAGCFGCWTKTPGKCRINDAMNDILPKIIAADVLIWSFPLYYYSVPGVLKNIIDRQLPASLPFMAKDKASGGHPKRYDTTQRRHLVISTCGFWTAEGNYDAVTPMFDHVYGAGNYAQVFSAQGAVFQIPELKKYADVYLETVRRAGAEFAEGGLASDTQNELMEPIFEREFFEKMADASWNIAPSGDSPGPDDADGSLAFTTQMAALYQPDGELRVVEFHYTDIGKRYQILLNKDGSEVITEGFQPHTTCIETPISVWRSISRGEISGHEALFQRLFTVTGDFSLMLKWGELFSPPVTKKSSKANDRPVERKSNLLLLLVPWIVLWIGLPKDPVMGGAAGVMAAALIPLWWLRFRPVIYEQITIPLVAGISLAAMLGVSVKMLMPGSALLFGLMWTIGAFVNVPLTAHYSAKNYGGERCAFANPLFLRTNRILTAAWGIMNLATSCLSYAFMNTHLSNYIVLINQLSSVPLGIFTLWFQKWYPARWARG